MTVRLKLKVGGVAIEISINLGAEASLPPGFVKRHSLFKIQSAQVPGYGLDEIDASHAGRDACAAFRQSSVHTTPFPVSNSRTTQRCTRASTITVDRQ